MNDWAPLIPFGNVKLAVTAQCLCYWCFSSQFPAEFSSTQITSRWEQIYLGLLWTYLFIILCPLTCQTDAYIAKKTGQMWCIECFHHFASWSNHVSIFQLHENSFRMVRIILAQFSGMLPPFLHCLVLKREVFSANFHINANFDWSPSFL